MIECRVEFVLTIIQTKQNKKIDQKKFRQKVCIFAHTFVKNHTNIKNQQCHLYFIFFLILFGFNRMGKIRFLEEEEKKETT